MTDQQQQMSPTEKRVSFSQDVTVNLDLKCSKRDRRKMYLSAEEMQAFEDDAYDEADWAQSLGEKALERDDCLRGLEMMMDDEDVLERRRQKFLGHLAVFMEQDRQFFEDGCHCPIDFDSMAKRYGNITKLSKELARKRGIFYREMEKETDLVVDQGRIRMPTTSLEPRPRFSVGPSAA